MADDASSKPGKFESTSQEAYEKAQMKWFDKQKKMAEQDGQESSEIGEPGDASAKNPVKGGKVSEADQTGRKK